MIKYWYRAKKHVNENRFSRFLFVGLINSLFSYFVFSLLVILSLPVFVSLVVAAVAGIAFNFFTTGGIVFRNLSINRLPKFIISYVLILLLNYQCIELLDRIIGSVIAAQAILCFPLAVISYFMMSIFVFNKKKDQ